MKVLLKRRVWSIGVMLVENTSPKQICLATDLQLGLQWIETVLVWPITPLAGISWAYTSLISGFRHLLGLVMNSHQAPFLSPISTLSPHHLIVVFNCNHRTHKAEVWAVLPLPPWASAHMRARINVGFMQKHMHNWNRLYMQCTSDVPVYFQTYTLLLWH